VKLNVDKEIKDSFEHSLARITEHHDAIRRLTKELKVYEAKGRDAINEAEKDLTPHLSELVEKARFLLLKVRENPQAEFAAYALAAVDYLVNEEDARADFKDESGLDDDKQVLDQIIAGFGIK